MRQREAARALLDSELMEAIRQKLYQRTFDQFVDGTAQMDQQGENPHHLALAAARRRNAIDDVVSQVITIARETAGR